MSAPIDYSRPEHQLLVLGVAIEELEAAGQAQLLRSDVIPTAMLGCTEELLAAMGFELGDVVEGDPIWRYASLPHGWTRRPEVDARGSYLVDDRGQDRAHIFYRAVPYDRKASMVLLPAPDGQAEGGPAEPVDPDVTSGLPLPPTSWPAEVHVAQVARLWSLSQRLIRRWAHLGMLPGRQATAASPYWFRREDIDEFARQAIRVREVRPGQVIRFNRWHDGAPCRVVEVNLVDGAHWRIGGRPAAGGDLAYAPPCQGDRIVLRLPSGTGGA